MRFPIQLKIVSVIVLVLLAGTATSVYLTVTNQRNTLLEAADRSLSVNTELLNLTIRNLMLAGEAPVAVRTITSLQAVEQFEEIAIYRIDGVSAFSDNSTIDFVNGRQNQIRFEYTPRVERTALEGPAFRQVLESNTPVRVESVDRQELEYFFPILNLKDCRACHGDTAFLRGVAHFRVSIASVYDQINAARNTLALILLAVGAVIAGLLILSVRRAIVAPILSIERSARVVGAGNLETRINLKSRDELGDLAAVLNDMIAGLKERNELLVTNSVVEARNAENRKYLDTIQEGLLLVGRDGRISEQFSRYLVRLFGREDLAGSSFVDFVYPDVATQANERRELEQFLDILFNNTLADLDMIMQINPLKGRTLEVADRSGKRQITVDATFHRVVSDGVVGNVMVIFQDRTEIAQVQKELAVQRERSQTEIEQIATLLRAGPQAFTEFVAQAEDALEDLELHLGDIGSPDVLERLFRKLHSLKGAARYLELGRLESSAHEAEGVIAEIRDRRSGRPELAPERRERLGSLIRVMRDELEGVNRVTERFRSFAEGSASRQGAEEGFLSAMRKMTLDIASELGKKVEFVSEGSIGDTSLLSRLRDPVIHLIRNAVDHGIEEPLERVSKGKAETGTVKLAFSEQAGMHIIQVSDDGGGIDFESVRKRAVTRGLLSSDPGSANRAALLRVLFVPNFSSRSKVSSISGRGVGLDVVHDAVKSLGGQIYVASDEGKGARFTLRIPRKPS